MNAKQAKRLRRIARQLARPEETRRGYDYSPGTKIKVQQGELEFDGKFVRKPTYQAYGRTILGRPIQRQLRLGDCERAAYQQAKDIYKHG